MNLGLYRTQIIGVIGVILMVIAGRGLIVTPGGFGFIETFFLNMKFAEIVGNGYEEIRTGVIIFAVAFMWSYFSNKKNLKRIFYCMIALIVCKWIFDIFFIHAIFPLREWKFTTMIMFAIGFVLAKNNLLSDNNISYSNEDTSN